MSDPKPETWSDVYNAFNPHEPVPPDKIDAWHVERRKSPLNSLVKELSPHRTAFRQTTEFAIRYG